MPQASINRFKFSRQTESNIQSGRIWFPFTLDTKTILTKHGQKSSQALLAGSGRENITVQMCISATGKLLPLYVIYKGE